MASICFLHQLIRTPFLLQNIITYSQLSLPYLFINLVHFTPKLLTTSKHKLLMSNNILEFFTRFELTMHSQWLGFPLPQPLKKDQSETTQLQ